MFPHSVETDSLAWEVSCLNYNVMITWECRRLCSTVDVIWHSTGYDWKPFVCIHVLFGWSILWHRNIFDLGWNFQHSIIDMLNPLALRSVQAISSLYLQTLTDKCRWGMESLDSLSVCVWHLLWIYHGS